MLVEEINDEEKQSIPSDFFDLRLQVAADKVTDSRNAAKHSRLRKKHARKGRKQIKHQNPPYN